MKLKIIFTLMLVLSLTSCSVIDTYFPTNTTENNSEQLNLSLDDLIIDAGSETVEPENETESSDVLFTVKVKEGEKIALNIEAEDPDGDEINYLYSDPLDAEGVWQTQIGDAGTYMATISASDGSLTTTETVMLIIEAINKVPVVECPDEVQVKEGEKIEIPCTFSDPDGEKVDYKVVGFMDDLEYQTTYDDEGEYTITVIATDGIQSSQKEIKIIIRGENRPPVLTLENEAITVTEKETAKVEASAEDPDGDEVEIYFEMPINPDGEWETEIGDSGEHILNVFANDGEIEVKETIKIIVKEFNLPPSMTVPSELTYDEGDLIELPIEVSDPNGDEVTVTISGFMSEYTYQTDYDDAGEYEVTITASDGVNQVTETIDIVINNVNRPPQFVFRG